MQASSGPHLLYVAWGFPPCRSGGVYRALATANRFAQRGWRVTVLSAERETFARYTGVDTSLESKIDPRVIVERIPFAWPAQETDLRRWSRPRMERTREWNRLRAFRDRIPFPEVGYGPWRRPLELAVDRIHNIDPVDLVVATANPHVAFAAAWRLHRRGVPYVLDYRDAWLLDVFSGRQVHGDRSRAAAWERRLVQHATEVWFVNDQIREWHQARYPERADVMHTVANGFDAELAPALHDRGPVGDRPVVFGYLGTMTPKVPLAEFVSGWRLARATRSAAMTDAEARLHGYLGFYATPRTDMLSLIESAASDGMSYHGPVHKGDIGAVYETFDVQLLILATGLYVTSGKVFEYLATGLPIVSVHHPSNAASDVLRGHPLWFPASDLTVGAIAAALERAAIAARTASTDARRAARASGARFRRELQIDPRIESLESALAPAGVA